MTPASPDPLLATDGIVWARLVLAMGTVALLIAGLGFILKWFAHRQTGLGGSKTRRRLRLVESLPLDMRRRAVIIACDDVEHLVLLGSTTDTVIASPLSPPPEKTPEC
jgi:flagellar biogenesis protein FliO